MFDKLINDEFLPFCTLYISSDGDDDEDILRWLEIIFIFVTLCNRLSVASDVCQLCVKTWEF